MLEKTTRHARRDMVGARIALQPEEGDGYWGITRVRDDIYVVIQDFAYKEPRIEAMGGDGLIQFNFRLSGDLSLGVCANEPLRLTRPSLFLWSQPPGIVVKEWTAPKAHERAVSVSVRPQYLIEHLVGSLADVPAPLRSFFCGGSSEPNFLQLPLTADMFEIVIALVENSHEGVRSLVYIEAKALELLCEAMLEVGRNGDAAQEQYSERELRCLHAARDMLTRRLGSPPTIEQVARFVGMNETMLMRSFRAVFGETLFDFSVRCRMQHALTLLRQRRLPVSRVAEAVGYQHQTSFSTAFRRHFGARPRDIRPIKHGPDS